MTERHLSRRNVLRRATAATSLLGVGGLAGCSESLPASLGGSSGAPSSVPEDAESIYYTDVDAVLGDEATKAVANAYIDVMSSSEYYEGPESYEEALQEFNDETDLDVENLSTMTAFAEYTENDYGGTDASEFSAALLEADWTEDELIEALEEAGDDYGDSEHEGKPLYEPESEYNDTYLGILSEGHYVMGTKDAVEAAIEVEVGEKDAVSGELKAAFEGTQSAPVRWASIYPESSVPENPPAMGEAELNTDVLAEVDHVTGAVFKDGETRGIDVNLEATTEDAAKDVADLVDGSLSLARGSTQSETLEDAMRDVTVERDGTTVTISFERTIDGLTSLIEDLDSESSQSQSQQGQQAQEVPTASFSFDYEETGDGEGIVDVTHDGGDTIPAENLTLSGFGITDADGDADNGDAGLTEAGQWPAAASSGGQVQAGNTVSVGVTSDYELRVIFQSEDSSATLAMARGPDA